jgi:hypothetical protein
VDPGAVAQVRHEVDEMLLWTSVVMNYSLYLIGQSVQPDSEPGTLLHMGRLIKSGEGIAAQQIFTVSQVQLGREIRDGGRVPCLLGYMWVVFVFAEWEHVFRPRLAEAKACSINEVEVTVFGDLRHYRHDILHHGGVATKEHAGKCEVLRWFGTGDPIDIRTDHVLDFQKRWGEERSGIG